MATDVKAQDPKIFWQEREPETDPVSLDSIHDLARRLDNKKLLARVTAGLCLLAVLVIACRAWTGARDPLMRAGSLFFLAGELGAIFVIFRDAIIFRDPAVPVAIYLRRRLSMKLAYLRGGWTLVLLCQMPVLSVLSYSALREGRGALLAWIGLVYLALLVIQIVRTRIGARKTRAQLRELDEMLKPKFK